MPRPARSSRSDRRSDNRHDPNSPFKRKASKPKGDYRERQPAHEYVLDVLPGLEAIAENELADVPLARDIRGLRFWYPGDMERLNRLKSVVAVYRIKAWDVPRPRGFLGNQQLSELATFVAEVARVGGHKSFRLGAAGKESSVMQRLASELEGLIGLTHNAEEGELLLRFRPEEHGEGWEVLARMTPRPLSARAWRVCNMNGGLNATLAYAVLKLAGQRDEDRIFNPMSGSGTLLIERALMGPSAAMVGVDIDPAAVECAQRNVAAAKREIEVACVDALSTGLPDRSFDLILADLPWGDAIGTHGGNEVLYPAFLKEMYRLLSRQGRLAVITHEIKLFQGLLEGSTEWYARELFQAFSGGHHPKAYLLSKR